MSTLEKYSSYKDSGIMWIGSIPIEWEVQKLKFVADLFTGNSISDSKKSTYEYVQEESFSYIATKDIRYTDATINYKNGLSIPKRITTFKIAPKNSTLLCIEGGSAGKKIAYLNNDVCFVNKLVCINSKNEQSSKYLYYLTKSGAFDNQFKLSLNGLIGGVSTNTIKNFYLLSPTKEEQTKIANFLDTKTAQINEAIKQKEELIRLLKERWQVLIHKVVTQGLDATVEMKDSGVEWIGEIPEGWEIVKNRVLFSERNEAGNENLPILMVSIHTAVSSEEIDDAENIRGKIRIQDKTSYKLVEPTDIVFNMMRAWQGAIGAVRVKGMVSPAYVVGKSNKQINAEFFEYQYRTDSFIQQMDRFSKGITDFRKRLYWSEFKQLNTILPPLSEQHDIVEYIKRNNEKIENAISLQEKQIEKIKEYKVTLIDSLVTGKKRV